MYSKHLDESHKKESLTINNIEPKLWPFEVVPFLSCTVLILYKIKNCHQIKL